MAIDSGVATVIVGVAAAVISVGGAVASWVLGRRAIRQGDVQLQQGREALRQGQEALAAGRTAAGAAEDSARAAARQNQLSAAALEETRAAAAEAARANRLAEEANKLNAAALDHAKSQTERRIAVEAGWGVHQTIYDDSKPPRRQHYITCRLVNRGVNVRIAGVSAIGPGQQIIHMMPNPDLNSHGGAPMDFKRGHHWNGMSHWGVIGDADSAALRRATKLLVQTECDFTAEADIPPWVEPDWNAVKPRTQ